MQGRVKELYKKAIYTHCAAHSLNLALNSASRVVQVKLAIEAVEEICFFFDASPLRSQKLRDIITASSNQTSKSNLIRLCPTRYVFFLICAAHRFINIFFRWVERHDAIQRFFALLPQIHKTLRHFSDIYLDNDQKKVLCTVGLHKSQLYSF